MIRRLVVKRDTRGLTCQLWEREKFVEGIAQVLLSESKPGVVRAWHRHRRGQDDLLTMIRGKGAAVLVMDRGFQVYQLNASTPQLLFIPGNYWHGTIAITHTWSVYMITRPYDEEDPDEERLPPDHEFPGLGKFEWEALRRG